MTARTCPNCGIANRANATFCQRCVTSLGGDAHAPTELLSMQTMQLEQRTVVVDALKRTTRAATSAHALPDGTQLDGFRIECPLGEGGFGIVYLAWDEALERHVAIKEYMPYALATREDATLDVTLRAERDRPVFDAGLKSFVNEARLLARFDHPSLVKVFRFWEANRTAYMAMPYYEGPTLKAALADLGRPASEQQLRDWLGALLAALSVIHREQCYHRDISPDNILLTAGGPLLLDFGAARRVISDRTQALTAMLKPGFAPIEQYGGVMLQGPWTDLYALAAVVRYAITGRPPIASVGRVVEDMQQPLAQTHAGRYSDGFLRAIDTALSVRPEHRPQDVAEFRALLAAGSQVFDDFPRTERLASPAVVAASPALAPPAVSPVSKAPVVHLPQPVEGEPTAFGDLRELPTESYPTTLRAPVAAPRRRSTVLPALGVALIGVIAAATWFAWPGSSGAPGTAAVAPAAAPPAAAAVTTATAIAPVAPETVPTPILPAPVPVAEAVTVPPEPTKALPPPLARTNARAPRTAPAERSNATSTTTVASAGTPVAMSGSPLSDARNEQDVTSSYKQVARPPRCGELVLKASLEPLNPDDIAFLKNRCR